MADNRSVSLLLAFLLVASCARTTPEVAPTDAPPTYLWRVSRGDAHGWLLGSVHFAIEGSQLDSSLTTAFEAADSLAVELDVDALSVRELTGAFREHGELPEGSTLDQLIGEESYRRVRALLADRKIVLVNLPNLKPWVINLLLMTTAPPVRSANSEDGGRGGALGMGVDRYFVATARDTKPVLSLETLQEQIAAFSSADEDLQAWALEQTLDALDRGDNPLMQVVDSYFEGNVAEVVADLEDDVDPEFAQAAAAYNQRLLVDRNHSMAARIEDLMAEGRHPFVVVGAGHLVGRESIPELLTAKGYAVEPVPATGTLITIEPPADSAARLPELRVAGHALNWPAPPQKTVLRLGDNDVELEVADAPPVRYMLSRSSVPRTMVLSLSKLYEQSLMSVERQLGTPVESQHATTVSELPANRYRFATEAMVFFGLHVWADDTLYDLGAVVPTAAMSEQIQHDVETTLGSFRLDTYTDAEAAEHRAAASSRLAARPGWLFEFPTCPATLAADATKPTDTEDNPCDANVDACIERCETGDALACMHAGETLSGHGEDPLAVAALHTRACGLGLAEGCTSRASLLFLDSEQEADQRCGADTFAVACDNGEPWACAFRAAALLKGRGVEKDEGAGRALLPRACELAPRSAACRFSQRLAGQTSTPPAE